MYLIIEENPNCATDERVFSESGSERPVRAVEVQDPKGNARWCHITGVEEGGSFSPAKAVQIEDSSAGAAWLIFGGSWGVRFQPQTNKEPWSLENSSQWGEPFLVHDISGTSIQFD